MRSVEPTRRTDARRREQHGLRESTVRDFRPIGTFTSSATRTQLLGALKRLKPQIDARLRELETDSHTHRYQLEVDVRDLRQRHLIDPWLGVKSALTSAFPVDKPGAVRELKP